MRMKALAITIGLGVPLAFVGHAFAGWSGAAVAVAIVGLESILWAQGGPRRRRRVPSFLGGLNH